MKHPLFTKKFYRKLAEEIKDPSQNTSSQTDQMSIFPEWQVFGQPEQEKLTVILKNFQRISVNKLFHLDKARTSTSIIQHINTADIIQLNNNIGHLEKRLLEYIELQTRERLFVVNTICALLEKLSKLLGDSLYLNETTDLILQLNKDGLTVCPEGVLTHLQNAVRTLQEPSLQGINFILSKKEQLIEQIIAEYVSTKIIHNYSGIHHVNAVFDALAEEFGLTTRPYENYVKREAIEKYLKRCTEYINFKLTPMLLVKHIAVEFLNKITPVIERYKSKTGTVSQEQYADFTNDFDEVLKPYRQEQCFNLNYFLSDLLDSDQPVSIKMQSLDKMNVEVQLFCSLMRQQLLVSHEPELIYYTPEESLYSLANYWFFIKSAQSSKVVDLDFLKRVRADHSSWIVADQSNSNALVTFALKHSDPETVSQWPINYIRTVDHLMDLIFLLGDDKAKDYFLTHIQALGKEVFFLFKDVNRAVSFILENPLTSLVLRDRLSINNRNTPALSEFKQHVSFIALSCLFYFKVNLAKCSELLDKLELSISPYDFINIALIGCQDILRELFPKLVGINKTSEDGLTALMLASSRWTLDDYLNQYWPPFLNKEWVKNKTMVDVVKVFLLHPGIDINQLRQPKLPSLGERIVPEGPCLDSNKCAFTIAIQAGKLEIAKLLLDRKEIKVLRQDSTGRTALSYLKECKLTQSNKLLEEITKSVELKEKEEREATAKYTEQAMRKLEQDVFYSRFPSLSTDSILAVKKRRGVTLSQDHGSLKRFSPSAESVVHVPLTSTALDNIIQSLSGAPALTADEQLSGDNTMTISHVASRAIQQLGSTAIAQQRRIDHWP